MAKHFVQLAAAKCEFFFHIAADEKPMGQLAADSGRVGTHQTQGWLVAEFGRGAVYC